MPAPFGPSSPSRSPRETMSSRSFTTGRSLNFFETPTSSATSLPERPPAATASFTLPSFSRRAARVLRKDSSRRTRPSLRVRRASMPLRIQISSCAQKRSNLRAATDSASSSTAFLRSKSE